MKLKTYLANNYVEELRNYDSETREFTGKQPNGIFVTITNEPVKTDMFNFNATGDKQNNTIWGNNGKNIIKGMAGNDTLYGKAGDDEIRGGKGNDIIVGGWDNDRLFAEAGSDTIYGFGDNDTIHYTGGKDRYISEERNTHYYVDNFNNETSLAISDNITPVEKFAVNKETGLPEFDKEMNPKTEKVVSTDDRLYISADKNQLNFLFDVTKEGITTKYDGLCILNKIADFTTVAKATVNNNDVTTEGGIISINSFFAYDKEAETITYGNGQIEHLYYKQDDSNPSVEYNLENTITAIATNVANWLNSANNTTGKTSAFEVFNSADDNVISSLIIAYTNPLT